MGLVLFCRSPGGRGVLYGISRKVRTPQGSVPRENEGQPVQAGWTESAAENKPPASAGKGEKVE